MNQCDKNCFRLSRFTWPDKAALVLSLVFLLAVMCLWSLAFLVVGSLGAKHLWGNFGLLGIELVILTVGLAWFAMRTADFLGRRIHIFFFEHESCRRGGDRLADFLKCVHSIE